MIDKSLNSNLKGHKSIVSSKNGPPQSGVISPTGGGFINGNGSVSGGQHQQLLGAASNSTSFCTQSPQMLNRLLTQSSTGILNSGGNKNGTQAQPQTGYLNGGASNAALVAAEKPNYIALFDYESATKDDMTIKKGDQLIVIDKSHPDWWLAKNLRTKETGYVPFNYITTIDDLQIKEY